MKTHLYGLFLGSASYNVVMAMFNENNERYLYASGLIIMILVIGKVMDHFDSKSKPQEE